MLIVILNVSFCNGSLGAVQSSDTELELASANRRAYLGATFERCGHFNYALIWDVHYIKVFALANAPALTFINLQNMTLFNSCRFGIFC